MPDVPADDAVKNLIEQLFHPGDSESVCAQLQALGAPALPYLLDALHDPRIEELASTEDHDDTVSDAEETEDEARKPPAAPFKRLCDLMQTIDDPRAATNLAPFLEHERDVYRKTAAVALGYIGTEPCIAPTLRALKGSDDQMCFNAMLGIRNGLQSGRRNDVFLDAIFPALSELLDRPVCSEFGFPARLLLTIDYEQAVTTMLSDRYFTVENAQLYHIVKALNTRYCKIPLEQLRPLLATARRLRQSSRNDYLHAELLMAYARNPDDEAAAVIESATAASSTPIAEAAAEALAILTGLANHRDTAFDAWEQQGFDKLPEPLQRYLAVDFYEGEVENGGHGQYFENDSGDSCQQALAGLAAIGANRKLKILERAIGIFGPLGPSVNQDQRCAQLEQFSDWQWDKFSVLDRRYYQCDENITILLAQYAMSNKAHFASRDGQPSQSRLRLDGEPG